MEQGNDLTFEHRLTAVEQRATSNTRRIDKLEQSTEALHEMATSMQVMSGDIRRTAETVDKLDVKVTALETKPVKRMNDLVDKAIWMVVAAVLGLLLGHFGL